MHSSHHAILRGAWTSPNEAGTATIGGAKMCGLFSSVGDGAFPVYLERDEAGDICRVTVKSPAPVKTNTKTTTRTIEHVLRSLHDDDALARRAQTGVAAAALDGDACPLRAPS